MSQLFCSEGSAAAVALALLSPWSGDQQGGQQGWLQLFIVILLTTILSMHLLPSAPGPAADTAPKPGASTRGPAGLASAS